MYYLLISSETSFQVCLSLLGFSLVMLLNVRMGGISICSSVLRKLPGLSGVLYCAKCVPIQCNDCRSLQGCPNSGIR